MKSILPFGPGSCTWLVNRERLVLLGGPAAAVLQVAHPQIARGVARHSRFRSDAAGRLKRTLDAVYSVAFGSADEINGVRSRVAAVHRPVRGGGYSAFDPEAQKWVMATLIMGSFSMFERFVRPLESRELEQFLEENGAFGEVFGLPHGALPQSWIEFTHYWEATLNGPLLGSDPLCAEVANAVVRPDSPRSMRLLSPVFRALALEYIPVALRHRLKLEGTMIQPVLWKCLDALLPGVATRLPDRLRFAPAYRAAIGRGRRL